MKFCDDDDDDDDDDDYYYIIISSSSININNSSSSIIIIHGWLDVKNLSIELSLFSLIVIQYYDGILACCH